MTARAPSRWLRSRAPLVSALGACLLLHAVAFGYGVISDDEAIYAAMAREVMAGGVMYRDVVDHKPPGIVMTYACAFSAVGDAYGRGMTAVHVLGLVVATATSLVLWAIGRRVLDAKAAAVAPLLYAVSSVAKVPYDGLAVNGELLMNLPTALAVLAALEGVRAPTWIRRTAYDLAAGMMAGCAVLYKYQAGLVLLALAALALERPRTAAARLVAWGAGFIVPLAGFVLYFRSHDALAAAEFWGLEFNRHYLAERPPLLWSLERLMGQIGGVVLPALVLYAAGIGTTVRVLRRDSLVARDLPDHPMFVAMWVLLSLCAVGLGGRLFGHYFLQAELPLALAAAGPASRFLERSPRLFALLVAGPAVFFACGSLLPLRDPGAWLDSPHADYEAIGGAIRRVSRPDDSIWVWGNVPQLYFTSRRRAGVRFTFCNYLTGLSPATPSEYDASVDPGKNAVPEAMRLALQDLDERRPRWIVDTAAAGLKSYAKFPIARYPALAVYLSTHYLRDGEAAGVPLYRRID
jgi:hypothetical protein